MVVKMLVIFELLFHLLCNERLEVVVVMMMMVMVIRMLVRPTFLSCCYTCRVMRLEAGGKHYDKWE